MGSILWREKCVVESNRSRCSRSSKNNNNDNNNSNESDRSGSTNSLEEPIYSGDKNLIADWVDDKPEDLIRDVSEQTTAHQWFGDGAYSLATGGGENKKRHNLAFCSNEPLGSQQ